MVDAPGIALLASEHGISLPAEAVVYRMTSPEIKSGGDVTHAITFKLLDKDGRVIRTDNSHQATISSEDSTVQVVKSTTVNVVNGKFSFDDIVVIA